MDFTRGAPGGARTPNLLIRSQMLYPLSYERVLSILFAQRPFTTLAARQNAQCMVQIFDAALLDQCRTP